MQSSLWSNHSFNVSFDKDPATTIGMLEDDLRESKEQCEELMDRHFNEREDAEQRELRYEKVR